mmetsp:Transcript_21891/g.60868  ORF Transcript_21891/g.60868 Transcript_21891/m.60868 type:complete len:89 (+) Transcript_21891:843-1109(+)
MTIQQNPNGNSSNKWTFPIQPFWGARASFNNDYDSSIQATTTTRVSFMNVYESSLKVSGALTAAPTHVGFTGPSAHIKANSKAFIMAL